MGRLSDLIGRLFGGSGSGKSGNATGEGAPGPVQGRQKGDEGIYFYVELDQSGEVVEIRLIPRQELVPDYKNGGYFSRKVITGPRTLARADALFRFDEKRRFSTAEIDGGSLSDEESYYAQRQE